MSSSERAPSLPDEDDVKHHVRIQVTDMNGNGLYQHQIFTSLSRSHMRRWCWESLPLQVIFERVLQINDWWDILDLQLVMQDDSFDHSYGAISLFGPTVDGDSLHIPAGRMEVRLHRSVDKALNPDKEIHGGFILTMMAIRCVREVLCAPRVRWGLLYRRLYCFYRLHSL